MMTIAYQFSLLDPWTPPPERPRPALVDPPLESNQNEQVTRLRASLASTIASKISSATELMHALEKQNRDAPVPTTIAALDTILGGGLARGRMIELAGRRSSGRFSTVVATLAASTNMGEAAALVDLGDHFDPQIAEAAGTDLRRLLWVRPQRMKHAVAAAEMLIATGFQLVVLDAGIHPIRGRRAPDAAWVRLARAAEAHGAALLVSAPYSLTGTVAEAVVQAGRSHIVWLGRGKSPRLLSSVAAQLQLERHRHIRPGRIEMLRFDMEDRTRGERNEGQGARDERRRNGDAFILSEAVGWV